MSIVHRPPTSIQIEPVFGCNLRCDFCPNCRLPKDANFRQMSVEMATEIAWQISLLTDNGSGLRLDMALRGEPLAHERLSKIVLIFRQFLPRAQISIVTNGYKLHPEFAQDLFYNGLNFLYIDCYGHSYSKWKQMFLYCDSSGDYAVREAKDVTHWKWHGNKKRCVILGPDIRFEKKTTRHLVSFCQALPKANCEKYNIPYIEKPLTKRCADPFRSMNITWDGKVLLCCRDWDEGRVMYDLRKYGNSDLCDYWYNNETLNTTRTLLYNKIRDFTPCNKCDYNGGVYLGNLPNPGQERSAVCIAELMDGEIE